MRQRILTSIIVLSLLATMPAWGQTQVISRKPAKTTNTQQAKSGSQPVKKAVATPKWEWKGEISDGMTCVKGSNGKYGFINSYDKLIVPCKWNAVRYFRNGLAAVSGDNGKWGYVDKSGTLVIPCKWKTAYSFDNDRTSVQGDNDEYYSIDKTGEIICKYCIKRFRLLETDLTANTRETEKFDQNGDKSALIKIRSSYTDFHFNGGSLGIVGTEKKDGEIWLYVPPRAQRLTIIHSTLGTFYNFFYPIPIKAGRTYDMVLDKGQLNN